MKRAYKILGVILIISAIILFAFFYNGGEAGEQTAETSAPVPETTAPVPEVVAPVVNIPVTEEPPDPSDEPTAIPDEVDGLPVGKLVITPERKAYEDGDMTLVIPLINVKRTVYNGTDAATLKKGVGLYEYAQLPGEGNRNVSIAGHRNGISNGKVTDKAPFYYIDLLEEGDYLYLYDTEYIYRYIWDSCEIVTPDNWDPIRTTGYSCLTLTSCHPIGISDHRIIVRGVLDEIIPYDKDYSFPESAPAETDEPEPE